MRHTYLNKTHIFACMEMLGFSPKYLAEKAGFSEEEINDILSGKTTDLKISEILRISHVFGVGVEAFIFLAEKTPTSTK